MNLALLSLFLSKAVLRPEITPLVPESLYPNGFETQNQTASVTCGCLCLCSLPGSVLANIFTCSFRKYLNEYYSSARSQGGSDLSTPRGLELAASTKVAAKPGYLFSFVAMTYMTKRVGESQLCQINSLSTTVFRK